MRSPRIEPLRRFAAGWFAAGRRGGAEAGQGLIEYGLILSLSAVWAALLLFVFGPTLSAVLQAVGDAIDAAT